MNYGELKSHFKDLLNRSDVTDALVERFVQDALSRVGRTLRVPSMERYHDLTVASDGTVEVPRFFLEMIEIYRSDGVRLVPKTYTQLKKNTNYIGNPEYYARVRDRWHFYPKPAEGSVISVWYYGDLLTMNEDADEDPIMAIAPDIILYAALSYAADYYLDERVNAFEQRYQQIHSDLMMQTSDMLNRRGGAGVAPVYEEY